jgi:hypothetical protein
LLSPSRRLVEKMDKKVDRLRSKIIRSDMALATK